MLARKELYKILGVKFIKCWHKSSISPKTLVKILNSTQNSYTNLIKNVKSRKEIEVENSTMIKRDFARPLGIPYY